MSAIFQKRTFVCVAANVPKRSSAKQVGSELFFAPKACHEKIARNAFARPVLNSYIVMSCPKEIEGVGQCVIKALYPIKGLGA